MVALVVLLLAVARPPAAYVSTPTGHVPLAVSSWCWGSHCGAPIAASAKPAVVHRGSAVRVELAFVPTTARVAVGGKTFAIGRRGRELTWTARNSGGMTISVTGPKGWVAYVGRLVVR
jgi:hypothetical protein